MEENQPSDSSELTMADPGQTLFTKFSMKALFGFTTPLESGTSKDEAVLKGFRNVNGDINVHVDSQEERSIANGDAADPGREEIFPDMMQAGNTSDAQPGTDSIFVLDVGATAPEGSGMDGCSLSILETADSASGDSVAEGASPVDSKANEGTRIDSKIRTNIPDDPETGACSPADPRLNKTEQNEPSLSSSYSLSSPLSEFSKQDDKDAILVQGILVCTVSDAESDNGSTDPERDENIMDKSASSSAVSLEDGDQNKDIEEAEGYTEMDDNVMNREHTEQTLPSLELPSVEMHDTVQGIGSDSENVLRDECNNSPPATGEDAQDISLASNSSTTSLPKPASGEKTFQLPAFFSGLRVRKKGLSTDAGETVTEIKQKDSDLAMLKLKQPVKNSNLAPDQLTKRKPSEPKTGPTFLEQLSQFLGPKNEAKDPSEGACESRGSEEGQEGRSSVKMEPSCPSEEAKPSPAESALDAFKALFTRPPKKETTADTSELEAIKRKMRHEKEALKAVFERSRSKSGDGAADTQLTDASPSEQDDKTPGRLQTVWPPPKAKNEEEKVGLKYTEAGNIER
ncbi:hypothetical protein lerEdw1_017342 [Lerista edwardsae]|nr:hypothetical protein lerEdw1_017342 [Lerista edwardsae]